MRRVGEGGSAGGFRAADFTEGSNGEAAAQEFVKGFDSRGCDRPGHAGDRCERGGNACGELGFNLAGGQRQQMAWQFLRLIFALYKLRRKWRWPRF